MKILIRLVAVLGLAFWANGAGTVTMIEGIKGAFGRMMKPTPMDPVLEKLCKAGEGKACNTGGKDFCTVVRTIFLAGAYTGVKGEDGADVLDKKEQEMVSKCLYNVPERGGEPYDPALEQEEDPNLKHDEDQL